MRNLISIFEQQFEFLHDRSVSFVSKIPPENLFSKIDLPGYAIPASSCGELILRSAAMIEQSFGGLTVKLWDDPFEWTLPEELSTHDKIVDYLNEVRKTRETGFAFLTSDSDLVKEIPAPIKIKTIAELLIETIARAENYFGRADFHLQLINSKKVDT